MKKLILLLILLGLVVGSDLYGFDKPSIERMIRNRRCPRCDLYRANLSRLDLTGVDLRGANLAYAILRETTLFRAKLRGADLRGTIFDGAVWIDGAICQTGSVGFCRRIQPE
jgi:uncharacterized protein YjbI with pentapeptide repeats